MENKFLIPLEKNPSISIKVIPGHFATNNSHISHYIDMSDLKTNALLARDVAREFAVPYLASMQIETIVCMEKTEVIGAYLAEELLQGGEAILNSDGEIHVVTPIKDINGNLIFPNSVLSWISNRSILLLVASISTGRTLKSALECLTYYGGKVNAISTLFKASHMFDGQEINALFTADDILGYKSYAPDKCEMCKEGLKLDAIVNSAGYKKITERKK